MLLLQGAADSRIPVFSSKPLSQRLSRPLANLSNKVRAHLSSDSSSKHRQLFGILSGGPGKSSKSKSYLQPAGQSSASERPARPTKFFESLERPKESFSLTEVSKLEPRVTQVHLGERVCVAGHRIGVLRYLGKKEPDHGTWCGIEFDQPIGLNDGSEGGVRYFACPPLHGVLVPATKVSLALAQEPAEFVSEVSDSGPHSLLAVPQTKRHSMGEEWLKEEGSSSPPVKRVGSVKSVSQASTPTPSSTNSNGALIWDWTIGSQHSSSAGSLVPSARAPDHVHVSLQLSKHSSFEFDDSLGILTPDQMADFAATLPRTPSTEDGPFHIQDLDFDKENDTQSRGSKRSSLERHIEEVYGSANIPDQRINEVVLSKREDSLEDNQYSNEIVMEELAFKNISIDAKDDPMEIAKDLSDTEMSDSNPSKKASAMSVSYEPGSETVSNSENIDFVRVNRTPSLEDLPMDKTDGKIEALAGQSKHVLPPPTSFVTSVTSIASLDNGYQGDGEWSRPASRGADHSPMAGKQKALDPMTDSDFFTESDADMHDDTGGQTGSGTGRGDRKAQVIDGTLYGGVSGSAQHPAPGAVYPNHRCTAFTPTTEEMDSSGIYSDLERKPEEPNSDGGKSLPDEGVNDANENEKDFSPEGSTRTGSSMKSDMSQTLISSETFANLVQEQMNTIMNLVATVPMESTTNVDEAMEEGGVININKANDITDVNSEKTIIEMKDHAAKKREEPGLKKYKMPKRNVVSKIKTMITSNTMTKKDVQDENQENRRPLRPQRKSGRWDDVMNKIAQGKEEEKTKPSRLKEVKSKVFQGITTVTVSSGLQHPVQARNNNVLQQASRKLITRGMSSQSASSRSLRDISSLQAKSRRSRTRGSECSLPAGQSPGAVSQGSSRNSSLSDVSLSKASPSPQSLRSAKKRDVVRSSSPQSDGSTPGRPLSHPHTQTLPARILPSQKNGSVVSVSELKGSPVRKPAQRRLLTATAAVSPPATKPGPLRDVNRLSSPPAAVAVAKGEVVTRAPQPVAAPQPPAPPPPPTVRLDLASRELKHAAHGVEALGVLLNYLVYNLDAFSTPQLKKDLDKMRADWVNTKLQMEEVRVSYLRSEEEKTLRLQEAQTQLQVQADSHAEHASSLTKVHEEAIQELKETHEDRVYQLNQSHEERIQDMERTMTTRIKEVETAHLEEVARLKEEHGKEIARLQEVAAERLTLREKELNERLTSTQAEYDNIKEQSRRLLDSMHCDKDAKLQATAGRCKMLQDEVASLRSVLDLRIGELQELRRSSEVALRDAQQLPPALQRITVLQARVEDLELQLQRKAATEQTLAAEKAAMAAKVQHEDKKNKRLSQHNEELMWKLKHSSEVVSMLAAISHECTPSKGMLILPPQSNMATPKHCHSEGHLRNGFTNEQKIESTPGSPKVKGVVEKSDSVSWVLDLDESPVHVANRLVRRAHSMRAVQSANPSPAHATHTHTLPNPHKRQRSRTTTCVTSAHKPQRARSYSFDSDSSEVPRKLAAEWEGDFSPTKGSMSSPSQSESQIDDTEDLIVVETIGEDRLNFLDLDQHLDREKIEVMGGEDFASPKLSSSSGGSEVSVRSRKTDQKTIDAEEILMINRVDGLIASLPKESAGEAMISEETSDNDSGPRDSDEEGDRYCSDDDSLSGSASELAERRVKYLIEHKVKMDLKNQNHATKKVTMLLAGSDSGSLSAATTAMELSWSEDIDLLPSESEG